MIVEVLAWVPLKIKSSSLSYCQLNLDLKCYLTYAYVIHSLLFNSLIKRGYWSY